jgi:hypothetical protein
MIYRISHMIGSRTAMTVPAWARGRNPPYFAEAPALVRAVPDPLPLDIIARCRAAWAVLVGRAHAVKWPQQGELEEAMDR